jgi:ferric-dicitrate binding protein FerR (iron transport regulator)
MNKQFFYELVDKYLDGTATTEERRVVETYYDTLAGEPADVLSGKQRAILKEKIYNAVQQRTGTKTKMIPAWRRLAAAAVVLFVLSGAAYFLLHRKAPATDLAGLPQQQRFKNDIAPAHKGAMLTLADGSTIRLDSAGNGTLAMQGKMMVVKQDSTLSYVGTTKTETVFYNTVATARGQDYHLELADGTQVWLDALSSIHFPTSFPGKERLVEVTGQAYFEVAKDAHKPFRVQSGSQTVEVLGTHFNINAYDPVIRTTLLEGSIDISNGGAHKLLAPGQQSQAGGQGITILSNANLEEAMAWKNGRFNFNGATVEAIMAQLARWYDIDVMYKDKIAETFVVKGTRNVPVSRLLNLLEMTGQVAFTIDGKKVTVYNVKSQHP